MAETTKPGTFIPHDTAVAPRRAQGGGGGLNDLVLLSAVVLLVASGALGVGVFLYGQFLNTQTASKVAQLQSAEAAFEPSLISQITRLDDRMHAGDAVLAAHVAPTLFFQALSAATLQTVSFQTLDYEQTDAQDITLKMQGVAQSVNSIALQANLFSQNGVITSPIFSDIARQSDGVHFDLIANVNPSAVSFSTFVSSGGASGASSTPTTASAAPSSPSPFGGALSAPTPASTSSPTLPPAPAGGTQ